MADGYTRYYPLYNKLLGYSGVFGVLVLAALAVVSYCTNIRSRYQNSADSNFYKPLARAVILLLSGFACFAFSIQDAPFKCQILLLLNTAIYSSITAYLDSCIALLGYLKRRNDKDSKKDV